MGNESKHVIDINIYSFISYISLHYIPVSENILHISCHQMGLQLAAVVMDVVILSLNGQNFFNKSEFLSA